MNGKIKVQEVSSLPSIDRPNFVLTLDHVRSRDSSISNHYEAITKLVGNDDLVIGLDTCLMSLPGSKCESYFKLFLEAVRRLNLEYRCFESASDSESFFASLLKRKNTKKQEMLAYIPNELWKQDEFRQSLPLYGARYYITKDSSDTQAIDKMLRMIDAEKLEYFRMIVFDSTVIDSIGICSKHLTLVELKKIMME